MLRIMAAPIAGLRATEAAAQSRPAIRIAAGAFSGPVFGKAIESRPMCAGFSSGPGQTARLKLTGSGHACFTIPDVADCREDFSFRTKRGTYRGEIFQLFPAPNPENVTLTQSVRRERPLNGPRSGPIEARHGRARGGQRRTDAWERPFRRDRPKPPFGTA